MDEKEVHTFLKRQLPSRSELIQQCVAITNSLERKSRKITNDSTDTPGQVSGATISQHKPLKLRKKSTISFDCLNEQYDVLKYYDTILTPSVQPDPFTLARERTQQKEPFAKQTGSVSKKRRLSSTDGTPLPKLYYKPWPTQTHRLKFPFQEFYRFPEASAAALSDYRSRLQNDDSIELGLRIIAHINQESTPLTIVPSTKAWNLLKSSKLGNIQPTSSEIQVIAKDLRRKLCPYINCNVGLTAGFSTMMLFQSHWYATLVIGGNKLIEGLREVMISVSEQFDDGIRPSQRILMDAYAKALIPYKFPEVALVVIDSIGIHLNNTGWDMLYNFLFTCVLQSLGLILHTAGCDSKNDQISKLDTQSQELNLVCVSLQAVTRILWASRLQIAGPKQPDDRTCGAYGLASVWMLSTVEGFKSMSKFAWDKLPKKDLSSRRRETKATRCTAPVPMRSFTDFYDEEYMHGIMRRLDNFIRTELINRDSE